MKSDAWPFAPPEHRKKLGEGPFRVRGSVYTRYLERIQKLVPGGLPTICAEIGNKDVGVFLRDTIFLATSTYDIEPLMHIMRTLARLTQTPVDKFVREGSRNAAERDIVGTYRAQLRSASTEEMITRLPRIFGRYFDAVRADSLDIHGDGTEMRFSGLPASALGLYVWTNEGFVSGALEAVGARDVRFAWTSPAPDGEIEGVTLQSLMCRITWTNQAT
jgi:hypothetical protein